MLPFLLATLTIAPAEAPAAYAAVPHVVAAPVLAQGRMPRQRPGQARRSGPSAQKKPARMRPGPILRGMLRGASEAKQRIERRAAEGQQGAGRTTQRPYVQDHADEEQIREWFETCDHNENGWVSFREARASLRFDRPRYQAYDADRDGRLDLEEFTASYEFSARYGGGFKPPLPKPGRKKPRQRTPDQIRNAYDTDLDSRLSRQELARLLADYERMDVTPEQVLRRLDDDLDEHLGGSEIDGLVGILHPVALLADTPPILLTETPPTTIDELFGKVVLRANSGTTPNPPLIRGPVPHFRRLDLDNDGEISVRDLEQLLRPHKTGVRIRTVLNTLDLDGDGTLSEAEFLAALVHVEPTGGVK